MCVYVSVLLNVCMSPVCLYVCVLHFYVYVHVHMSVHVCMCACMYVCMCVCVYILCVYASSSFVESQVYWEHVEVRLWQMWVLTLLWYLWLHSLVSLEWERNHLFCCLTFPIVFENKDLLNTHLVGVYTHPPLVWQCSTQEVLDRYLWVSKII